MPKSVDEMSPTEQMRHWINIVSDPMEPSKKFIEFALLPKIVGALTALSIILGGVAAGYDLGCKIGLWKTQIAVDQAQKP
jgi:hypothetical protein